MVTFGGYVMPQGFGMPPQGNMTRNMRIAQMLQEQERVAGPVRSTSQGLAQMLRSFLTGQARRADESDITTAQEGLMKGYAAKPWVNPDTGDTTIAKEITDDGSFSQLGEMVPTGPAGGVEGMIASQQGMGDNPYARRNLAQLLQTKMGQDYNAQLLGQQRKYNEGQAALKFGQDKELARIKAAMPTTAQRNYAAGLENPGFADREVALKNATWTGGASQPGQPPGVPAPGSRGAIQGQNLAARNESNRLSQERLDLSSKQAEPEYIQAKKEAERTAALNIKRKEALPGEQSKIVSMVNSKPMFDSAIKDAVKLGNSMWTGGKTGMALGWDPSSDQASLERSLLAVKGIVGLDELITRKDQGGTFGALSDTEMQLLQASKGVFTGEMEGPELEKALMEVKRLHNLDLAEKQRKFISIYPNAERPWEKGSPTPQTQGQGSPALPQAPDGFY